MNYTCGAVDVRGESQYFCGNQSILSYSNKPDLPDLHAHERPAMLNIWAKSKMAGWLDIILAMVDMGGDPED